MVIEGEVNELGKSNKRNWAELLKQEKFGPIGRMRI